MDTLAFIARYEEMLRDKRIPKMQFYRECGVSDAAVSQWRKGKTNPSMTTVNAIAKYLGTSSEYLITGQSLEKEIAATLSSDGEKAYAAIFSKLSPANQAKLHELALLYLDAQRKSEES